jgi:aspartyl-tRNA(Asn)/glutamyl-tRNA(Gln) amidotransferase subunit A
MLRAVAGPDAGDPCSVLDAPGLGAQELDQDIREVRVGLALDGIFSGSDHGLAQAVERAAQALESAGARVRRVLIDGDVPGGIITTEGSVLYEEELARAPELFGDRVRNMFLAARDRPVRYYAESRRRQDLLRRTFELALEDVDVIITPSTPTAAPRFSGLDTTTASRSLTMYTGPANLTGLPALSVPCGVTDENLPVGMQIIGRRWAERQICSVGMAFETVYRESGA